MDVQQLSDRFEIDDLLTRYGTAIDGHDWDLLDTVFAPDAHLDYRSAGGIAGPYPQVRDWLAEVLPAMFEMTHHLVANRAVELDGDTATARSMVFNPNRYRLDGEVKHFVCGGYYRDRIERRPEGWRIVERVEDMVWWQDAFPGMPEVPPVPYD